MITRAAIENAAIAWVAAATSETAIVSEQGKPRPETPYLTVKVSPPRAMGHDVDGGLVDPGAPAYATQTYLGQREVAVSIQAYGAGAMDIARSAANALGTETTRAQLGAVGLFRRGALPAITDLTGLLDTDFQERAQFDVIFGLVDSYTDSVPLIETVEGQGTFDDRVETFTAAKP